MINHFPLAALLLAVSACTSVPRYETISSAGVATSALGGTAISEVGVAVHQRVSALTGAINRGTGEFRLSDGTYLFVDADGFDLGGWLGGGLGAGVRMDSAGTGAFINAYDYVIPLKYNYTIGGVTSTYTGTVGIETRGVDIPTSGTAQYVGEALADYRPSGGVLQTLSHGTSVVDVDFGAGVVDVVMGFSTTAPIDTISGMGMRIVGVSFFGGRWVTYKNGAIVNMTGAGSTAISGGDFYGYDKSISGPDEVAGVVLIKGVSGVVSGMYVAD